MSKVMCIEDALSYAQNEYDAMKEDLEAQIKKLQDVNDELRNELETALTALREFEKGEKNGK